MRFAEPSGSAGHAAGRERPPWRSSPRATWRRRRRSTTVLASKTRRLRPRVSAANALMARARSDAARLGLPPVPARTDGPRETAGARAAHAGLAACRRARIRRDLVGARAGGPRRPGPISPAPIARRRRRSFAGPPQPGLRRDALASWRAVLGRSRAVALLPEDAEVLNAAAGEPRADRATSPAPPAARARGGGRASGARRGSSGLERRARLGDVEGLRCGLPVVVRRHPLAELDDAEGHRQLSRLLALWPDNRFGSWPRDRRARIVRFFLEGRHLGGRPPKRSGARLRVLNGSSRLDARARRLCGRRSRRRPGISRVRARRGRLDRDGAATTSTSPAGARRRDASRRRGRAERPSPSARDGCEALLRRRALAGPHGDAEELEASRASRRAAADPSEVGTSRRGSRSASIRRAIGGNPGGRDRTRSARDAHLGVGRRPRGHGLRSGGRGVFGVSLKGLRGPANPLDLLSRRGTGTLASRALKRAS